MSATIFVFFVVFGLIIEKPYFTLVNYGDASMGARIFFVILFFVLVIGLSCFLASILEDHWNK